MGHAYFHPLYALKLEGRGNIPAHDPAIICPKHQFWTDIPIVGLAAARPLSFIAKQELFTHPVIRHFLTAMGGIPMDRQKPLKSLNSFRYVEKLLRRGESIVLFPEGTYFPHSMGDGKHRFIQLILRLQEKMGWEGSKRIPFVPLGIQYGSGKLRREVRVNIGEPLYAQGEAEGVEFTRRIMGAIASLSGLN
jgi:1-acyl-sn-glycerol-3-phosphate acyltransferase